MWSTIALSARTELAPTNACELDNCPSFLEIHYMHVLLFMSLNLYLYFEFVFCNKYVCCVLKKNKVEVL